MLIARGANGQGVQIFDGSAYEVGQTGVGDSTKLLCSNVSATTEYSGTGSCCFPMSKGDKFYIHSSLVGGSSNTAYYREIPYKY